MRQTDIFKKISRIVQELNEQYEYLQSLNGNYTDLDLELFAANAHFLTDHTEILRKLNSDKAVPQPVPAETASAMPELVMPQEEIFGEPVITDLVEPAAEVQEMSDSSLIETSVVADPEPVPLIQVPEVLADPQPNLQPEPPAEVPEPEATPVPELDITSPPDTYAYIRQEPEVNSAEHTFSISDSSEGAYQEHLSLPAQQEIIAEPAVKPNEQQEHVLTLNEKLSAQLPPAEQKVAALHTAAPVTDIKAAINLNDKLLFVKELFNGYSLYYSEAMDLVNRCKNFADADRFLQANYAAKNRWTEKQSATDKFYMALHRRFPQ